MMEDLIRRIDAINAINTLYYPEAEDMVKVVRCRECLRAEPAYPNSIYVFCKWLGTVQENDYCSWGQRREDSDEDD